MAHERAFSPSWNLFVRELEAILRAHDPQFQLSQLDDRTFIHKEKVRRLRLSLTQATPKHFPVLNPEELEEVSQVFQLTLTEKQRLHAALLVTAIERLLMDRMDPAAALQMAEHLLTSIAAALTRLPAGTLRIGGRAVDEETFIDQALEEALEAIDRGTLALHLSRQVEAPLERLGQLQQAREAFQVGLRVLEEAAAPIKASDAWQVWEAEARHGLEGALRRLEALE